MTRAEYLAELDSHLITLPREERDMAIAFYEEYFDEAGPENEQAVIDELGKPFNLARSIIGETSAYNKSEVYIKYRESKPMPQNSTGVFASLKKPDAFTEVQNAFPGNDNAQPEEEAQKEDIMPQGMPEREKPRFTYEQDAQPRFDKKPEPRQNRSNQSGMFDPYYTHAGNNSAPPPHSNSSMNAGWVIFWILMTIFVIIPIILPVAVAVVAVMAALGIAAIVCIIAALIAVICGIIQLFTSIPLAIAYVAAGILAAGIGFILLSPALAFFFKFLPWSVKKIFGLSRRRTA